MNQIEITERKDFYNSWLFESPELLEFPSWDEVRDNIVDFSCRAPKQIKILSNNLRKLELTNQVFYWFEENQEIVIGVSLDIQSRSLVVQMLGKNPKWRKKPPHAIDLYIAILRDLKGSNQNIVISDKTLSASAYKNWTKLFQAGYTISLYDKNHPGSSFKNFDSEEDMKQYFGQGRKYQDYRFVLSESKEAFLDVLAAFRMRGIRERNHLPLDED